MDYILANATVFVHGKFMKSNVFIANGMIHEISNRTPQADCSVYDLNGCFVFPGFIDVHVHLREPGFFYKETIKSGSLAAAHGGYTAVCAMPNLNPVPDCRENLEVQLKAIRETACIQVVPYGTITVGEKGEELAAYDEIVNDVCAFSDDGRGVQNDEIMREAMKKISTYNKIVAAHCEDNSLLAGGYIHKGEYAKAHGHRGICSESEWKQIERDLQLVKETGVKYHVCHISTKESVALIRKARAEGLDVTCETAPHYLTMNDSMLQEDGRFKMNPPIRSEEDREALIAGIHDWYDCDRPRSPLRRGKEQRSGKESDGCSRSGNCLPHSVYQVGENRRTFSGKAHRADAHQSQKPLLCRHTFGRRTACKPDGLRFG